jgi:hypothetical protein
MPMMLMNWVKTKHRASVRIRKVTGLKATADKGKGKVVPVL